MTKTLSEIAVFLGGRICGNGGILIKRIRGIEDAGEGDLTFVANPKYKKRMETTGASAILVALETTSTGKNLLIVEEPYVALGRLLALFHPEEDGLFLAGGELSRFSFALGEFAEPLQLPVSAEPAAADGLVCT